MKTSTALRAVLFGSCAVLALAGPALANETEQLKAQIEQQKAQIEQQEKLLNQMQSRLDKIDSGQKVESVSDINKRLDALETRQSAAEAKPAVAPADAVVGGDFPGSFKLPGSDTSMAFHGYAKLDFIYDVDQQMGNGVNFGGLALSGPAQNRGPFLDIHARQSRLNFETRTPTDYGVLRTYIEGDFFNLNGVSGENELISNSNPFRLRHAYGELGPLLAGQTWGTFMEVEADPELLDFTGQAGETFIRAPQIRWTQKFGNFTFKAAAENPQGDFRGVTPGGVTSVTSPGNPATGAGNTQDSNATPAAPFNVDRMPDLVARVEYNSPMGLLAVAGIVRRFDTDDGAGNSDDTIGGGGKIFGKLKVGYFLPGIPMLAKDEIGFHGMYGTGLGRYFMDGGVDQAAVVKNLGTPGVRIETQPSWGGFAWYQHWWTANLRSTVVYGIEEFHYSNLLLADAGTRSGLSNRIQDIHANLIWSPVKNVNIGVEAIYGIRDVPAGAVSAAVPDSGQASNDATRVQVSLQYLF